MRIAIIGTGAMELLFGGYLSRRHDVVLIDGDTAKVQAINDEGILIQEPDGEVIAAAPRACGSTGKPGVVDLILLFARGMDSMRTLKDVKNIIGSRTYLMSFQNDAESESALRDLIPADRIVLGTTQHCSSFVKAGVIQHGGGSRTSIGLRDGSCEVLKPFAEELALCGFPTEIWDNAQKKIP